MPPRIFITPWITLDNTQITNLFNLGADSARIHTGKLDQDRINSLIQFYAESDYKFYLDLRGNKAQTTHKLSVSDEDEIIIHPPNFKKRAIERKHIELNFIPPIIQKFNAGNIAIDDGNLVLQIRKVHIKDESIEYIETKVIKCVQAQIYEGDGISSTNIPIHSMSTDLLSPFDLQILTDIPKPLREQIKYIALSFCENPDQLELARSTLADLGYNAQIVPKVETIIGMQNAEEILKWLSDEYGSKAEVMIGRGDLYLDYLRSNTSLDLVDIETEFIKGANDLKVNTSVLALVLQSIRKQLRENPNKLELIPSPEEVENIKRWVGLNVYQIGLTNDMYVEKPERVVMLLKQLISQFSSN